MGFRSAVITHVIVTVVGVMIRISIILGIIGNQGPSFPTGNRFYIIKRKTAQIPIATQRFALITAPNGLAGIFQKKEVVFVTKRL